MVEGKAMTLRCSPRFLTKALVLMTLVSHLGMTVGYPLPTPKRAKPTDGIPYPCQSRPCGCVDSEQCWRGDCCCFTLEEKLTWAEANGVEPPEHVRPLVESRKFRPATPNQKSCCTETVCQSDSPAPWEAATAGCCEKKSSPAEQPGFRWVAGIFAQKCRGDGPAGLMTMEPVTVELAPIELPSPADRPQFEHPCSIVPSPLSSSPPIPPPKQN